MIAIGRVVLRSQRTVTLLRLDAIRSKDIRRLSRRGGDLEGRLWVSLQTQILGYVYYKSRSYHLFTSTSSLLSSHPSLKKAPRSSPYHYNISRMSSSQATDRPTRAILFGRDRNVGCFSSKWISAGLTRQGLETQPEIQLSILCDSNTLGYSVGHYKEDIDGKDAQGNPTVSACSATPWAGEYRLGDENFYVKQIEGDASREELCVHIPGQIRLTYGLPDAQKTALASGHQSGRSVRDMFESLNVSHLVWPMTYSPSFPADWSAIGTYRGRRRRRLPTHEPAMSRASKARGPWLEVLARRRLNLSQQHPQQVR